MRDTNRWRVWPVNWTPGPPYPNPAVVTRGEKEPGELLAYCHGPDAGSDAQMICNALNRDSGLDSLIADIIRTGYVTDDHIDRAQLLGVYTGDDNGRD